LSGNYYADDTEIKVLGNTTHLWVNIDYGTNILMEFIILLIVDLMKQESLLKSVLKMDTLILFKQTVQCFIKSV